jgi:hypothetical protein
MASTKSVNLALLDASPRTLLESGSAVGKMRVFVDTVAVTGTDFDANGDIVFVAEVPSNAKIYSIKVFNDDLDSGTSSLVNLGVYNGGIKFKSSAGTAYVADGLIKEDAYAKEITSLRTAAVTGNELAFRARDINAINNYIWEDAGLPEDPRVPLRIAFTQTATVATAVNGDLSVVVTYVVE